MAVSIAAAGGAGDDARDSIHQIQAVLLRVFWMRFGLPPPQIENRIRAIRDLKQLRELLERLVAAANWQELFPSE
jgi:hypothetical protein